VVATVDVQNTITIFVQVVAVTLLPAALVFLILLLKRQGTDGAYTNTRWQNIANGASSRSSSWFQRSTACRSCSPTFQFGT